MVWRRIAGTFTIRQETLSLDMWRQLIGTRPTRLTIFVWTRSKSYTNFLLCNFFFTILKRSCYRPQTKFAKVIFLQVSTGGGGGVYGREQRAWQGSVHGEGVCMAGGHAWQGGMHGRGACMGSRCAWQGGIHCGGHAWQGGMCGRGFACHACPPPQQILRLWHTVNGWAVRILLECILV